MSLFPVLSVVPHTTRRVVKLLVVDDHVEQFDHINAFAEMYHPDFKVECRIAQTTDEAVSVAGEWIPSVVLLDLHIAGAQGKELLQSLRAYGAAVVATSASRIPELARAAEDYGAVAYVQKSDNPEDVEALVQYLASISSDSEPVH
jgi:CheY-like chemotaxis protein